MDGEVSIQPDGSDQPFVYRGFRMVDEEKLRDCAGDELRKMNQNGMLPLIYAHLFSLSQMRDVFAPPDAAGQGAGSQMPQARRRDRRRLSGWLFGGGRELAAEQRLAKLDGEALRSAARRGRTRVRAGSAPDRDSSCGRFRSAARECRAPAGAWRSMTWPPANGSLRPALEAAARGDRAAPRSPSQRIGAFGRGSRR